MSLRPLINVMAEGGSRLWHRVLEGGLIHLQPTLSLYHSGLKSDVKGPRLCWCLYLIITHLHKEFEEDWPWLTRLCKLFPPPGLLVPARAPEGVLRLLFIHDALNITKNINTIVSTNKFYRFLFCFLPKMKTVHWKYYASLRKILI